jgi:ATP-dependent Clp protease protease subunit
MDNIKEIVNYCLADKDELYDREHRRLYLNSEIDESIIDSLAYMIMKYNRDDVGKPIEKRDAIILYINSPGGSVTDGFGLIDIMLASKTPVYTVNQGICYSM